MANTNTVEEVKRPRGRPPFKKADIVEDNISVDPWWVGNKDPRFEYRWGDKNDDIEMTDFYAKGYKPADGVERIMGNPLESSKTGEGEQKTRGHRILMKCPKKLVDARREKEKGKRVSVSDSANMEAQAMMKNKPGVVVEADATEETVRESMKEPVSN